MSGNPRRGHNLILFDQHRARIGNMKSDVDDKTPPPMPKSQRAAIERRQKEALIEQDNRILLDRLAIAMTVKNIDNDRKKVNFISLMEGRKKRENSRIEKDNKRLLRSIQHTVPVYNHTEWERDSDKRVHVLKNMTKFPEVWEKQKSMLKQEKSKRLAMEKSQQLTLLYKLDSVIEAESFASNTVGSSSARNTTPGGTQRAMKSVEYSDQTSSRGNSAGRINRHISTEKENASNHNDDYLDELKDDFGILHLDDFNDRK